MADVPHRGAPTIKKSGFFGGEDSRSERNCTRIFMVGGPVFSSWWPGAETVPSSGGRQSAPETPDAQCRGNSGMLKIPGFSERGAQRVAAGRVIFPDPACSANMPDSKAA